MTMRGAAAAVWLLAGAVAVGAQAPDELARDIAALGDFDYDVRSAASRRIRRAPVDRVVPALMTAARDHEDSYVQFRAAVLLSGLGGARAGDFFREALDSANDRVRAIAYDQAEQAPDPALVPQLLAALDRETSEFVRPALVRALAAHDADPEVRARLVRDIDQGEGYFRGAVIEALGDYRADYAVEPLLRIAGAPGPLRDDALLALGKIGDARARPVVAAAQTETSAGAGASTDAGLLPIVSATACLLDIECAGQLRYLVDALEYGAATGGADQTLLRGAAAGAAALAMAGPPGAAETTAALAALFDVGVAAVEPPRAPVALALGTVALRTPARVRAALLARADLDDALLLLRDAFDMLDEDLAEERFYVAMRDIYWDTAQTARARAVAEAAMRVLEF